MGECSSNNAGPEPSKKWACVYCTYLNWEASMKCVICCQPRNLPMIIPGNAEKATSSETAASTSESTASPFSVGSGATTANTTVGSNASPSPVPSQQQEEQQKKPNRCLVCNKRVGLTGFDCRCGGLFCGEHRYHSAHNCTFDYKTAGREELRAKHPQVITDKIERI
uniref:Zinc finger protein n=1 Tax=Globodera rostochiensis TaxID=31243 RepID=A0A914I3X1_GLORO